MRPKRRRVSMEKIYFESNSDSDSDTDFNSDNKEKEIVSEDGEKENIMENNKNPKIFENDEKENISENDENNNMELFEEIIEIPKQKSHQIIAEEKDYVIEISKFWPNEIKTSVKNIPEDKSLLFLCWKRLEAFRDLQHDNLSQLNSSSISAIKNESIDNSPKELRKFMIHRGVIFCHPDCHVEKLYFDYDDLGLYPQIKAFAVDDVVYYFLNVKEESIKRIPHELSRKIYKILFQKYLDGQFENPIKKSKSEFADTFDFPEAKIRNGFKMTLRDYQLRSISWMATIEAVEPNEMNSIYHNLSGDDDNCLLKFKLGDTPYILDKNPISISSEKSKQEVLRFYGGILADNTGSGKTITTLGLIHAFPFSKQHYFERAKRLGNLFNSRLQSRASCVICPSNIHKQWLEEAKKCNPKFKVYGLSNIYDHQKLSWQDIVQADVIIVSYQFLINSNYHKAREDWKNNSGTKGEVSLGQINFYRLIMDEYHEISSLNERIRCAIKLLQADFYWGLTGTPDKNPFDDISIFRPSCRFKSVCKNNNLAEKEFIGKHVKRNVPDLKLPEIENEIVWIDLSANEWAMFRWKASSSTSIKEQIMMCSHYQLSEKQSVQVEEFVPIHQLQKLMHKRKQDEIMSLKEHISRKKESIQNSLNSNPCQDISYLENELKITENKLQSAECSLNYFQSVFQVICEPDKNECRICFDIINESNICILPCSHLFCYNCVAPFVQKSSDCPLCRIHISGISDVYRIRIKESEILPEVIDTSKYSSKLLGLYNYVKKLIQTDPNSRIILFLQFSDLTEFIAKCFKELQIPYARVAGNVYQRQNAIKKFKESKDVRLIMMSSEDSVSGINLTEATHIILLHPFWTGKGEEIDLAYEKQGISRAYRSGLDHPLKVVRFAVRDSVEDEITKRRHNIKL